MVVGIDHGFLQPRVDNKTKNIDAVCLFYALPAQI